MDSQAIGPVAKKTVQIDGKPSSEGKKVPLGGSISDQQNDTVSLSERGQAAVSQPIKSNNNGSSTESKLRKIDVTDNNQVIIKIVDGETQEVVRQIPNEEEVRMKQAIQENLDNLADGSEINQNVDVDI
jgi:uncharacterized FlaG/YvyC family protein